MSMHSNYPTLCSTGASVSLIEEEVEEIQRNLPDGLPNTLKERVVNVIAKAHNIKDISVESTTQKFLEVFLLNFN